MHYIPSSQSFNVDLIYLYAATYHHHRSSSCRSWDLLSMYSLIMISSHSAENKSKKYGLWLMNVHVLYQYKKVTVYGSRYMMPALINIDISN